MQTFVILQELQFVKDAKGDMRDADFSYSGIDITALACPRSLLAQI